MNAVYLNVMNNHEEYHFMHPCKDGKQELRSPIDFSVYSDYHQMRMLNSYKMINNPRQENHGDSVRPLTSIRGSTVLRDYVITDCCADNVNASKERLLEKGYEEKIVMKHKIYRDKTSYSLAQQAMNEGFVPIPMSNYRKGYLMKGISDNTVEQNLDIFKKHPCCNVNIRTGRAGGITVIDIETR